MPCCPSPTCNSIASHVSLDPLFLGHLTFSQCCNFRCPGQWVWDAVRCHFTPVWETPWAWIKAPAISPELYISPYLLPTNPETTSLFHYHLRSRSLLEMATSVSFKDLKYNMPHLATDPLQTETLLLFILPSSNLAWRIPGMGEPGGLPSMGSHRVGHDWCDLAAVAEPPSTLLFKLETGVIPDSATSVSTHSHCV